MFKLFKAVLFLMSLGGAAYLLFFVPFGDKSLFQHMAQIAKTEQAKELGAEIDRKYEGAKRQIVEQLAEETGAQVPKDVAMHRMGGSSGDRDEVDGSNPHTKTIDGKNPRLNSNDRRALDILIDAKDKPSAIDRDALADLIKRLN